jgi:hypothetical protein
MQAKKESGKRKYCKKKGDLESNKTTTINELKLAKLGLLSTKGRPKVVIGAHDVQAVISKTVKYADCFVEKNPLSVIQDAVHRIDTKDDLPVTSRPYRMSWQEHDVASKSEARLYRYIRPSTFSYCCTLLHT